MAARTWMRGDDGWTEGATLPASDRAVRYGMAVFETFGVRDGAPLLAQEHLELLGRSTRKLLGTACPVAEVPPLDPACRGMLRVYVTAGDGGPTDAVSQPRVFAMFEAIPDGATPDFQAARMHPEPVMPFGHGCKTANYWTNCAAQAGAIASGYDHALLRDPGGNILSAAFGNLFFVLEGALCTPSLSLAVRPGVIRAWVVRQHDVRETEFPADRLGEATELFVTNSRLGVMPLRLGSTAPGPVGCSLQAACRAARITP